MDDLGAAARFNQPVGVAADGAGILYVADNDNHTIRKVVISTGAVTTLAGAAGQPGSTDGTGSAARFNEPIGVAVDAAGALYVADAGNHTIRKVVIRTGVVTTLAGSAGMPGSTNGAGVQARFNEPYGIAVDGAGALYVADRRNHTIRKVVVSTGETSTLAGSAGMPGSAEGIGAAARFNQPIDVAVDAAGILYVADSFNHTIRKIVASTGSTNTLAGSAGQEGSVNGTGATARFNGPSSVAVDGAGALYVTDYGNHTIRKVVVSTGAVTTLAGSAGQAGSDDGKDSAARFNYPHGVVVDADGTIYVSEVGNHTIRKVVNTGAVTTLAGSSGGNGSADGTGSAARFSYPDCVAADGAGTLYIADTYNHTIRKVAVSTGAVSTLAGSAGSNGSTDGKGAAARFNHPEGIAIDGTGALYVADYDNHTIRKVVVSTGEVTTLAGSAGQAGSADDRGAAARFNRPFGVAVDSTGILYVADSDNHTIRKVVVGTGVVTTLAGSAGVAGNADDKGAAARFNAPVGVAVDGTGTLYVADYYNHTIRKIVVSTGAVTTLAGSAGVAGIVDGIGASARFNNPLGVATDDAGTLYVGDFGNRTIRKIVLASSVVTTFAGIAGQGGVKLGRLPGRLNRPRGVAFGPGGELFIAEQAENAILSIH